MSSPTVLDLPSRVMGGRATVLCYRPFQSTLRKVHNSKTAYCELPAGIRLCLVILCYVRLCSVIFDDRWLGLVLVGYVWFCVVMFSYVWLCFVMFDSAWLC